MGFLDRARDLLAGDDPDCEPSGPDSPGATPEESRELDGLSPEEVELIFCNLSHPDRLNCIEPETREISAPAWRQFDQYIRDNKDRKDKWGIGRALISANDGLRFCKLDEEVATRRVIKPLRTKSETVTSKTSTDMSMSAGISAGMQVGADGTVSTGQSTQESLSTGISSERSVYECGSYDGSCALNRRAFTKIGNLQFSRGATDRDGLRSELQRIKGELGIDAQEEEVEDRSE